jgi:shikimate dehydrogenase
MSRRYLTGLFGTLILASRSPDLHEREADAQGVRLVYLLYDFDELGLTEADLPKMLDAARAMGFAGLNITHPYKQAVVPHLDSVSEEAARIGAVNTITFRDGRTKGYNTDCSGFAESLERGLANARFERVVQVGAGGAGAATAHALLGRGAGHVVVHDQDRARAACLVAKLADCYGSDRAGVGEDVAASLASADGLVNATPMGMKAHAGLPVPAEALRPDLWVADIVYFPLETELLRAARALGCRTLDGSGMVVFQAAAAFDLFTGLGSNRERMLASFRESRPC